jgi:hypothetical protein
LEEKKDFPTPPFPLAIGIIFVSAFSFIIIVVVVYPNIEEMLKENSFNGGDLT